MTRGAPVQPEQIARFDTVIDARSPGEFALDHVPGALNCPVLDDDERRIVGTLYHQRGAFEARRVGGAMVAANLARHLSGALAEQPAHWRPLVYCWRGGLRSAAMVSWLRMVGWDAQQLAGGYKSWRRHVVASIARLCPTLRLVVLCGATGSAKTRLLHLLAAQGAQVLDLEQMARHRGSVLGGWRGQAQPTQKHFETLLAEQLEALDPARIVFVEGESPRIGRVTLPLELVQRMREARCIEIDAPPAARLDYLLRDYADLGEQPQRLAELLGHFQTAQGKATVQRWQAWACAGRLAELFAQLMQLHYDPHYARSQPQHFRQWAARTRVAAPDLSAAKLDSLARQVLAAAAA